VPNPIRSEADAFRALVYLVVAIALLAIVVLVIRAVA
jgi:hypothetical protein